MELTIAFKINGLVIAIPFPRNSRIFAFQNGVIYPFWKIKGIKNLFISDFFTLEQTKNYIFEIIKLTFASDKVMG